MKNIILLHGAIGDKDQLEPLSYELEKSGLTTHSFNFSGHGQTSFKSDFGIAQFSLELEEFITLKKLEKPCVFGYSMGGYVALYLAHRNKNLIRNIITLGTKFNWNNEIAQKEVKMLDVKTITEKVPKFADALQKRHGHTWQMLLQKTADMMLGMGNRNPLLLEDYDGITNKTLIGLADKDNMVTLEETTSVFKRLKNGSMYMLADTKHPIETVNVKLLSEIILQNIR